MPFLPSILNSRPLLIGVILLQWIVMTLLLNFSQVNNSAMPSSACTPSSGLSKPKERVDVDQILAGPFLKDPDEILDFPSLPGVGVTVGSNEYDCGGVLSCLLATPLVIDP